MINGDVAHYWGIVSCASVYLCPRCAPKIRADRCQDAMRAMAIHAERGGGCVFLTQTIPHHVAHDLKTLLNLERDAWEVLCNSRTFKGWCERAGYVGRITSLEVTCNFDQAAGWHPHKHVMLFTERPLSFDERSVVVPVRRMCPGGRRPHRLRHSYVTRLGSAVGVGAE